MSAIMERLAEQFGKDAFVSDEQRVVPKEWYKHAEAWLKGYDEAKKSAAGSFLPLARAL